MTEAEGAGMSGATHQFENRGRHVKLWQMKAEELYWAASLVWHGKVMRTDLQDGPVDELHLLYRPAQLLMGLCLEVALKGLLVHKNPDLFDGDKLPKCLNTHSLERLFRDAGLALEDSEEELNLVRKLSDAVEWIAKYPVPLHADHLKHTKHRSKRPTIRNDKDFLRFEGLRNKIMAEFKGTHNQSVEQTAEDGGSSP